LSSATATCSNKYSISREGTVQLLLYELCYKDVAVTESVFENG